MQKLRKNLGANLRQLRGELNQYEFAKKLGISQASLNRIENGFQNVSIDTLERIATRLKMSVGQLLDKDVN